MQGRPNVVGDESERAVSPVIGVILMVAITVILAAVIAATLTGFTDNIGESAPNTGVEVNTNSDWNAGSNSDLFYLTHKTGDSLDSEDIQVILRNPDGATMATLDMNDTGVDFDGNGSIDVGTGINGDFSAGSTINVSIDAGGAGNFNSTYSHDEMTVQLIHEPSETTVEDTTVDLP